MARNSSSLIMLRREGVGGWWERGGLGSQMQMTVDYALGASEQAERGWPGSSGPELVLADHAALREKGGMEGRKEGGMEGLADSQMQVIMAYVRHDTKQGGRGWPGTHAR